MFEAITDNIFFKLALVVVAACCIMSLLSANAESEALRAECAALEEQISDTNERILSLENDLSGVHHQGRARAAQYAPAGGDRVCDQHRG